MMPIQFQLRKFLESPGMYDCVMRSLVPSNDGTFRSVVDGRIWKERKELFDDRQGVVVPLNVYLDDFNTSDTASTHAPASSICGVYINIPCLPMYLLTKLNNILVAGYVKTVDKKSNDNNRTFNRLIETLDDLDKNGIKITIRNEEKKVYFALCFVLGDNLGMNGITGFVESFRAIFFAVFVSA